LKIRIKIGNEHLGIFTRSEFLEISLDQARAKEVWNATAICGGVLLPVKGTHEMVSYKRMERV
jgi:hypothetical protein